MLNFKQMLEHFAEFRLSGKLSLLMLRSLECFFFVGIFHTWFVMTREIKYRLLSLINGTWSNTDRWVWREVILSEQILVPHSSSFQSASVMKELIPYFLKVTFFELPFDSRSAAYTPCCSPTASFLFQATAPLSAAGNKGEILRVWTTNSQWCPCPSPPTLKQPEKFLTGKEIWQVYGLVYPPVIIPSSCLKPPGSPLCEVKLLSEVSPSGSKHPHEAGSNCVRHRQTYRIQPTPADRQLNTHIRKLTLKKNLVRQNSQFCSEEKQKQKG